MHLLIIVYVIQEKVRQLEYALKQTERPLRVGTDCLQYRYRLFTVQVKTVYSTGTDCLQYR